MSPAGVSAAFCHRLRAVPLQVSSVHFAGLQFRPLIALNLLSVTVELFQALYDDDKLVKGSLTVLLI